MISNLTNASRLFALLTCLLSTDAISANCIELEKATSHQLTDYLSKDRGALNDGCIESAIDQLALLKQPSSVEVLVWFLDFRRVSTASELAGATYRMDKDFPVVSALVAIGPRSLPAIEKAIQDERLSDAAAKNAVIALMSLYSDSPADAITILRSAYSSSRDSRVKGRLLDELSVAMRFCGSAHRSDCVTAAGELLKDLPTR